MAGAAEAWKRQAEAERRNERKSWPTSIARADERPRRRSTGLRAGGSPRRARDGHGRRAAPGGARPGAVAERRGGRVAERPARRPGSLLPRWPADGGERRGAGPAVAALMDVPESVAGRGAGRAALRVGAPAREHGDGETLDWTSFHVELARAELAEGKPDAARKALLRMSAAARTECSVLLVRREVTRAERRAGLAPGDKEAELAAELARSRARVGEVTEPSAGGELPVCVDPEEDAGGVLVVRVRAAGPRPSWRGDGTAGRRRRPLRRARWSWKRRWRGFRGGRSSR